MLMRANNIKSAGSCAQQGLVRHLAPHLQVVGGRKRCILFKLEGVLVLMLAKRLLRTEQMLATKVALPGADIALRGGAIGAD